MHSAAYAASSYILGSCRFSADLISRARSVQVLQMSWDGSLLRVCSLGGGPPAVLGGALAERLLVVRGGPAAGPGGQAEVSQRHLPLLGPLLTGWAALAASNILPGAPADSHVARMMNHSSACWPIIHR